MIELRPYDLHAAWSVFQNLDAHDHIEAEMTRGFSVPSLQLLTDWHAIEGARLLSLTVATGHNGWGTPFAVLGLMNTGQGGVAQAALLSRSHEKFRRPLAELGLRIRNGLAAFAVETGVHRIEARCWAGHPTASGFLTACGFTCDCDMPGFGSDGRATFRQFAWTNAKET
ncbi:hypothetical protein [Pseudooceanicola sp.]|uniref:hypothetical protein n=1 Tax=Pseudooceanicola sp. TaxID=1914328 RepID=UPI004057F451